MNAKCLLSPVRSTFTGIGQVMFQQSCWTGLLFLAGIFWGSYENHIPQVAWGALVGAVVATLTGYILRPKSQDLPDGLDGFNGTLVGCAFPTFLANDWMMWIALIFCSAMTVWVRLGFNNVMAPWKVNSLTFPFVFCTWVFLFAARMMHGIHTFDGGLSTPELITDFTFNLDTSFGNLVIYWLKGISQVFLINSWVTGIFFLCALAVCSRWACMWAAVASAVSLGIAIVFQANSGDIANGLFGFSPVLTGIAVGCTFFKPCLKSALWTLVAIIATVFVQAGMDDFFAAWGLPTLTGPFCITTWLFLLPCFNFNPEPKIAK